MRFLIIPYISLGLVLSLAIGIEYNCIGHDMSSTYYGSPFVFKQKSLRSSMEYFYSISGLVLNILVWSFFLFLIDNAIRFIFRKSNSMKLIRVSYNFLIGFMVAFTTLNIAMDFITIGRVFDKNFNYWYWDNIDKEAEEWGMTCKGEIVSFRK
ncbi:MAG: hypothetical protein ACK5C0_00845 [Candidatus Kapaibacterium sp.]|jgi:hypothetical protein